MLEIQFLSREMGPGARISYSQGAIFANSYPNIFITSLIKPFTTLFGVSTIVYEFFYLKGQSRKVSKQLHLLLA